MSAGLFGKLPAKRDFVAANAPRRFLETWEPWLQAGVAASKQTLAAAWAESYNRAPIWRYWLGANFCGEALIGAFMPSVDGVGRAFPLTIFAFKDDGALAPPEIDDNGPWCDAAEALLLSALDAEATLEAITDKLAHLPPPASHAFSGQAKSFRELSDGGALIVAADEGVSAAFLTARRLGHRRAFSSQSFWWTIGGEGFPACALSYIGLPPPERFVDLMTGAFAETTTAISGESSSGESR
jgi:type VI secretion system protein ImpM